MVVELSHQSRAVRILKQLSESSFEVARSFLAPPFDQLTDGGTEQTKQQIDEP